MRIKTETGYVNTKFDLYTVALDLCKYICITDSLVTDLQELDLEDLVVITLQEIWYDCTVDEENDLLKVFENLRRYSSKDLQIKGIERALEEIIKQ